MAWWGKLVGGSLGFLVGGPIGSVLGFGLGHFGDSLQKRGMDPSVELDMNPDEYSEFDPENKITAIDKAATFLVMGYMARMDGRIKYRKNTALQEAIRYWSLTESQRELAIYLFDKGKGPNYHPQSILEQYSTVTKQSGLPRMFLETHVRIALADCQFSPLHSKALHEVGAYLNISDVEMSKLFEENSNSLFNYSILNPLDNDKSIFLAAMYQVMGYVANADGNISDVKISILQEALDSCSFSQEQRQYATGLIKRGASLGFNAKSILDEFHSATEKIRDVHREFLAIQVEVAVSDGYMGTDVVEMLYAIGDQLRLTETEIKNILEDEGINYVADPVSSHTIDDCYAVLGINSRVSDSEVRNAYRRLMSQFHPDKFESKNIPDEMMEFATEKTRTVRAAYETICGDRGIYN